MSVSDPTVKTMMSNPGTFWEKFSPIIFSEERLRLASIEVKQVLQLLDAKPGERVLDVGCGIGRHSLELAKLGYVITGLDITPSFIKTAQETALKEGTKAEFIEANMLNFVRPKAFDIAISLFSSFGYFEDHKDNQMVLANICQSLVDGGRLVLQLKGKEVTARTLVEKDWDEVDGYLLLQERTIKNNWNWIESRMIFLDGSVRYECRTGMWQYSATELTSMLTLAGFSHVDAFGDFDRSPYDNHARKTVMVARK
jgi:SAM-dependent methyltransferase